MKISFQDTISKQDWLHSCLLNSLTAEAIDSGKEKQEYDVMLLVNGIQLEPTTLEYLLSNIEKHIDNEAKALAEQKLQDILFKTKRLDEIVNEACKKIRDEFGIEIEE